MSYLIKPAGYKALLNLSQTEMGIKKIKDFFQQNLSSELRLRRVTAPLFVLKGMGINDDLNGTERAVTFPIKDLNDSKAEIVHSLAKWKRLTLADYHIEEGYGIYTDMNAIRSDEELGNLHSLYVDQWDWEKVIPEGRRNFAYLKELLSDCADKLILPEAAAHSNPSWFGFLMTCREGVDRTKVVNYIESHGVQTRMLFSGNLIKHPCFDDIRGTEAYRVVGGLEQTDRIMTSTFWVGVYPGMTDEKIEYMAKVIHEALEG